MADLQIPDLEARSVPGPNLQLSSCPTNSLNCAPTINLMCGKLGTVSYTRETPLPESATLSILHAKRRIPRFSTFLVQAQTSKPPEFYFSLSTAFSINFGILLLQIPINFKYLVGIRPRLTLIEN